MTPHEDKDDDNDDGDDDDDDDDHDDCKCRATSGLGRTCFNIFGETTWNAMSTIQHVVVVLMASIMTVSKSGRLATTRDRSRVCFEAAEFDGDDFFGFSHETGS